jgi:hypothetical protein
MRSKKIIMLLVLVIGIWGVIGFQIYSHLTEEDHDVSVTAKWEHEIVLVDTTDQFPLLLNYPDPFLKKVVKDKDPVIVLNRPAVQRKPIMQVQAQSFVAWDRIEFLGIVYNTSRQSTVAIVRIYGTDYMVRHGDIVKEFYIEEVANDSVGLTIGKEKKYIRKSIK